MTSLRIGWASPWNRQSAIAQSAAEVASELAARGHSITVLRTETGVHLNLPPREAPGPIYRLADYENERLMGEFDVVVGQIGNYYGYHGALLPRLGNIDIVGIMHDFFVHDLLAGWTNDNPAKLKDILQETYGPEVLPKIASGWGDLEEIARERPLLEWVARRTIGAVGHAEHYAARLRAACPGPVAVMPLAFDVPPLPPPPPPSGHLTVAVIGHANPNKRIDQLIMAVSASYMLRARCRIRVIGEATEPERKRLTTLAKRVGVQAPEFTGWVDDNQLARHLQDVDVMSCLRNPVLEGASASLVLAMSSGRPTLITRHGCYAEVPQNAVLSCSPEHEALDVVEHLERLISDPSSGTPIGQRARAFERDRHSPASYVDKLQPLLEQAIAMRPVIRAKREMTRTLAGFGLRFDDIAAKRVRSVLDEMTGHAT